MSVQTPELLLRGDRAVVEPWAQRDAYHRVVNGLGQRILLPGDAIEERLERDNSFLLTSGDHLGWRVEKAGTRVVGAAGARVTRLATFENDCHVEGVEFYSPQDSNNPDYLVYLSAESDTTFVNCRFRRLSSQVATCIFAENGAKARFVGCHWSGGNGTGTLVSHTGAALNIGLLGSNKLGVGLGNASAIFITT